jgi:hypothetical protein
MNTCPTKNGEWLPFLLGDLEEARRSAMAEHLDTCPGCRNEVEELRAVVAGADSIKGEIRRALDSVDWDALPGRVADYVYRQASESRREPALRRLRLWAAQAALRPVLAGLALGVVLGSLGMYLALRRGGPAGTPDRGYYASAGFIDNAQLQIARRETLDYLERSQYLLLDFVQKTDGGASVPSSLRSTRAKDLLLKKKYLNAELDRYQMAKAKAICDQIEVLFQELAQVSGTLPEAELQNIRDLIQERQLLLKINIVKKELESEV